MTVFVEALDFKGAEQAAVELLRGDESLRQCKNDQTDPPMLHVEEMREVSTFDKAGNHRTGFVFYNEDESD